jgi:hypothetical protein
MEHPIALAELIKRGRRFDFFLLNAGMVQGGACSLRRGGSGPADRPSSIDCRIAPFPK